MTAAIKRQGRARNPSSAMCRVEALIRKHGPSDANRLVGLAPDLNRKQIVMALLQLSKTGRIAMWKRGRKLGPAGTEPAIYAMPDYPKPKPDPLPAIQIPRIRSVFDLGQLTT